MFNWLKKVTGWSSVGTILKARFEMFLGAVMAGVASLAAFSFLPYLTDTIDWKVIAIVGGYAFVTGFIGEIVRRKNANI